MSEVEAVGAMIGALNAAGISFLLVGTMSSNAYGIPHSTKNADFVVKLGSFPISKLLELLPPGFRMESQIGIETITSARRYRLHFDGASAPFRIDLFEISDDLHDQERMATRLETQFQAHKAFIPRAEDVVIAKLRWSKGGQRGIHVDDARDVLAVQMGRLDMAYIRGWCDRHGTRELLEETLKSIPPLPPNS